MKHLKTYELFSFSTKSLDSNVKNIIEDRLQELDDMDYKIIVGYYSPCAFSVEIIKHSRNGKWFNLNEVLDNLFAMSSELVSNGFMICSVGLNGCRPEYEYPMSSPNSLY